MGLNRVTIIHPSLHLIGGAERLMTDLAVGLARKGVAVEVVTGVCHSIWRAELGQESNVAVKELGKPASGSIGFWLNVRGYSESLSRLVSSDADFIVSSSFPAALVAEFCKKVNGAKVVHYLHEAPMVLHDAEGVRMLPFQRRLFYRLMSWRYGQAEIEAVRRSDLIVANSFLTRKINAKVYGIDESAIDVVYPCVNGNAVCVSSKVPDFVKDWVASGKPVIFVPRGTQSWRRPDVCLQALKNLRVGDFVAVFTGGTKQEVAALMEKAGSLGIAGKIRCIQELSDEDVSALYSHSTVVVTIPLRQPFGMVPLEALVCGAPSVIFDSSGVSEVLRDGVEVVCVPDGDLAGLTGAIEGLILDSEKRERIVSNGRRKVLEEFTSARFVEHFKEKLEKTMHIASEKSELNSSSGTLTKRMTGK